MRDADLPRFCAAQLEFAAHVRNPAVHPAPADVEPRRMRIYVELIYNNVERFLANTFPIARRLLGDEAWHGRVRDFVHRHRATSPFFQDIPQEFLEYLGTAGGRAGDPPFLLELLHYEWVELALDLDTAEFPADVDRDGDLVSAHPVLSPLAWPLAYRYPVHRIAPGWTPVAEPPEPTHLVAYRSRSDRVEFLESNVLTARLIAIVGGDESVTGGEALDRIAAEVGHLDPAALREHGRATLERLRECDIIVGTREPVPRTDGRG
jgi:hypothetical protein